MTPGRTRGLDHLSTDEGVFAILAIDHRDSLQAVLAAEASPAEITAFKDELVRGVGPQASGVMLEPEFSLPQLITSGALTGSQGFMAALEAQGYLQDPWAGPTELLDGWSARAAKTMGAAAAKLLLPYDPDRSEHAARQRQVVTDAAAVCHELDLAFLVEPVAFGMAGPDRPGTVLRTVEDLTDLPIDVLKLEFPGDPADPDGWADACVAVDAACRQPWVLLSAGVTFEQYRDQLAVAFASGCSGFTGGRAIWRPASDAAPAERAEVIATEVHQRFAELRKLAVATARPWRQA
ncbi:MAG: tagatose 1,6-diphosphate aldolase [Actinomycetota bacterium]